MRRLAFVIIAGLALAAAAQAIAAPSVVIEEVDRTRTLAAGDLCDFDVVLHSEGTRRTTTYTNADGSLDRFTIHLSHWKTTLTNPATGASIRTVLAGPVIVEARDDGSALVRIPGNDGLFVVKGQGPVYGDNGYLVYVAPDPVNWQQQIEVLHASGGYRTTEDFAAAICGAIG
ncbi:MAG TPA: hypothetical protein VIZ29_06175 [Gaiellaceae bacterium]